MMKIKYCVNNVKSKFYPLGLLFCLERKTITNISKAVDISHDRLQREFEKSSKSIDSTQEELIEIAKSYIKNQKVDVIIDDTTIAKPYHSKIEGRSTIYNTSKKQATMGFAAVTVILKTKKYSFPISADLHFSKEILKSEYLSKGVRARKIIEYLSAHFTLGTVIADCHYGTVEFLTFLNAHRFKFLTKIPRNRIVEYQDEKMQVKKVAKLVKNTHSCRKRVNFKGLSVWIYAVKLAKDSINYYVSNYKIDRKRVFESYRTRWFIEKFHRTAKQKLGLQECQSKSSNKQHLHILNTMKAYQYAEIVRHKLKLPSVDAAINYLRKTKSESLVFEKA